MIGEALDIRRRLDRILTNSFQQLGGIEHRNSRVKCPAVQQHR